jgi:flavin reductase (DIM6/NTAB) family NADH-FMN oxidoreductase RutF
LDSSGSDQLAQRGRQREPGADVVRLVAECPIQMACRVVAAHPFGSPTQHATAFTVEVLRTHVEADLLIPGTHYVDPLRWDPLIMKFCEFFGGGRNLHPFRLAEGWQMPHDLRGRTALLRSP